MRKIILATLVVAITISAFLFVSSQSDNVQANMLDIPNTIEGTCYPDGPGDPLDGLIVTCTGPNGPFITYSDGNGHYLIQTQLLEWDSDYTIEAKSVNFESQGGWKGTIYVHTPSCENPPCTSWGSITRNITCAYYDSPN